MIISAEDIITGFEEDIVVLVDFGGRDIRLIVSGAAQILSVIDVVAYTGHIAQTRPMYIQTLNLEVDFLL